MLTLHTARMASELGDCLALLIGNGRIVNAGTAFVMFFGRDGGENITLEAGSDVITKAKT